MNKEDLKIIEFKPSIKSNDYDFYDNYNKRYCIVDKNDNIIDNAQGYGYKSKQKAYAAMNWLFFGGKEKKQLKDKQYNEWLNENELHQKIIDDFEDITLAFFKDIYYMDNPYEAIWEELELKYSIVIPEFVRNK